MANKVLEIDVTNIENGSYLMMGNKDLVEWVIIADGTEMKKLSNGYRMFYGCTALETFYDDLSNLSNGSSMFQGCTALTSFSADLSNLTDGYRMFYCCTALKTFYDDLSNLAYGNSMFYDCTNISVVGSNLNNLTNGEYMFYDCTYLGKFDDFGSMSGQHITTASSMFSGTEYLYEVSADLASLQNGDKMFLNAGCRPFICQYYNLSESRGLTDDGDTNGESAVYFKIGSLASLKTGYMMFADTKTYNYTTIPVYNHSPFALHIEKPFGEYGRSAPFEAVKSWGLTDGYPVSGSTYGGVTGMFDGRLIVGSKTLEYIDDIMFYNTSPSKQYFGTIYFDGIKMKEVLERRFDFYTNLSSIPPNIDESTKCERWSKTNIAGSEMYIDVIYRDYSS